MDTQEIQAQNQIQIIFDFYSTKLGNPATKTQVYKHIAKKLSGLKHSKKPWGESYTAQVLNRNLAPSKDFAKAINLLFAHIQTHPDQPEPVTVHVVTPANTVEPNSFLTIPSKYCTVCQKPFIPHTHNHIYCSDPCRRKARSIRRKNKKTRRKNDHQG